MKRYPFVIDVLFIVLFVGIGRHAHRDGITLSGMATTLWPFVVGLVAGWWWMRRRRRSGEAPRDGYVIVGFTVVLGMVLRVVSGQGTALAFIIVALVFLTLFLVGWRLVVRAFLRRR